MSASAAKKQHTDSIDDDDSPCLVAVERVMSNSGAVELPMLTKTNYHYWALVMNVSLEALELWDAVETATGERAKDRRALAEILRNMPTEMKAGLAVKASAKAAWDAVKAMRVGSDHMKAASVQHLWKEYENVAFLDSVSVGDFAMRPNGLVRSLREMGETLEDIRVVKKVLRIIPKRLRQVALAIEMLTVLNTTTIKELVGRLRVAEDAENDDVKEVTEGVGRLLLTEEQWEARRRQRCKDQWRGGDVRCGGSSSSVRRRNSDARGHGGRGNDDERSDNDDTSSMVLGLSRRGWRRNRGKCFEGGEHGHIARFCAGTMAYVAMDGHGVQLGCDRGVRRQGWWER